jgi:hypothetical protein
MKTRCKAKRSAGRILLRDSGDPDRGDMSSSMPFVMRVLFALSTYIFPSAISIRLFSRVINVLRTFPLPKSLAPVYVDLSE